MRVVAVFLLVNSVLLSFHAGAQQERHLNSESAFIGVTGEVRRDQAGTVGAEWSHDSPEDKSGKEREFFAVRTLLMSRIRQRAPYHHWVVSNQLGRC